MMPYKQLSFADIFTDCQEKFENDKPAFLSLSEAHIDIDEIIPISFRNHFYASTGRTRKYPLHAFLWALIIQRIFSIPTDQLLLTFLSYSKPLREFCGFSKVPDASKITRLKQDFMEDIQLVFDNLRHKNFYTPRKGCVYSTQCISLQTFVIDIKQNCIIYHFRNTI